MGEIAYNDLFKPPVVTDTVTITTQPQDVDCYVGGSATLSIVAESDDETAILSYQWQVYDEDWTDIVDATSTSYSASTAAIGDTTYRCNVTSDKGGSATSETAEVSVSAQPLPPVDHITITTQPTASTSVYVSQTATLSVVAESDDPDATLYYQWQVYDGEEWDDIVGASSSTYTAPTSTVGVNTYRVLIASSLSGTATSDSATVTVSADTVSIITNPGDTQVYLNEGASVYCQASSNVQGASLAFQWQIYNLFDEEWFDISGATGYIYSGMDTSTVGTQQFRCVITSSYGGTATTTSATVTVEQRDTITITSQPQGANGYVGDTITLSVTAVSDNQSATLSYQWQVKDGSTYEDISGATSSTYTVPTSTAGTERYRVIVSSDKGATDVTSNYADVTVRQSDIVTITAQPQSTSCRIGETATFSVTASSDDQNATLSYAWQVYNTLHDDWDYITGATSSTYSYSPMATFTSTYRVIVTSSLGGTATSNSATLVVNEPSYTIVFTASANVGGPEAVVTTSEFFGMLYDANILTDQSYVYVPHNSPTSTATNAHMYSIIPYVNGVVDNTKYIKTSWWKNSTWMAVQYRQGTITGNNLYYNNDYTYTNCRMEMVNNSSGSITYPNSKISILVYPNQEKPKFFAQTAIPIGSSGSETITFDSNAVVTVGNGMYYVIADGTDYHIISNTVMTTTLDYDATIGYNSVFTTPTTPGTYYIYLLVPRTYPNAMNFACALKIEVS